jgi:hypothetical protein
VLITEVKTVDRDANRGTVVKETNSLLIQYFVNFVTRLLNCFAQFLRGYYTIVEKNCRSLYTSLLTAILQLLRDFTRIYCLPHACILVILMMLQQTAYSDRFIRSFFGNYAMIYVAILNLITG